MRSSWNPDAALDQVQLAHRDTDHRATTSPAQLAARAQYFATAVEFAAARPDAMSRLHRLTAQLRNRVTVNALLPQVLEAAIELTGADFGNVQLLDPATGNLLLTTAAGFDDEFCEYFAVVLDADGSACGRAIKAGQTAIYDVADDADFAAHRDIAAATGFRGVQSTPLLDYSGNVVAMVSTHFRRPHRPTEQELQLLRLYSDFAGQAIAAGMGAGNGVFDPIGRAMVSALLAPPPHLPDLASPLHQHGFDEDQTAGQNGDFSGPHATFAASSDRLIRHLFDVGLQLHTLRAVFDQADASPENVRAASDAVGGVLEDLDMLTRDTGLAMLALARDHDAAPFTIRRRRRR
ncbi:GAF domain-containing protein [Nocardia sp. NPDC049149]|uniref:GAF domain-containing protein n=1 Tax=Nocardia sp. NPDC049149 TaxID=3364315 RepID=UPI003717BF99